MTKFRAFGRFMPDGDPKFLEYDYPTEAAFKQDLGGNGFAAKYILPVDLIEKYDWDAWISGFGQKEYYGPNYKKLSSKFKQCIKWYEDNKDMLSQEYGIQNFYDVASLWVYYDRICHFKYPTATDYVKHELDRKKQREEMLDKVDRGELSWDEYMDWVKNSIKQ